MQKREILFKGITKSSKEWISGDLNHIEGSVFIFPRAEDFPLNSPDWFEVIPETVCQYVGLNDDNGVKIFTGDKIIDINNIEYEVEWNDDTCKFQLSDGSDINDNNRYSTYKVVVGNIHNNKLK
jgi:hypothetical protein